MMMLHQVHAVLQEAFDTVAQLHGELPDATVGADAAMAIGEALGIIAKAKALVARDIDVQDLTKIVVDHSP